MPVLASMHVAVRCEANAVSDQVEVLSVFDRDCPIYQESHIKQKLSVGGYSITQNVAQLDSQIIRSVCKVNRVGGTAPDAENQILDLERLRWDGAANEAIPHSWIG